MAKFTFTIDTGHAPMRNTATIAAALRNVANLIEPWGTIREGGRDVLDMQASPIARVGRWECSE